MSPNSPIFHEPVLLAELLAVVGEPRRVVDGTLGDGGHSAAFLAMGSEVLGIDRDPDALKTAARRLDSSRLHLLQASYSDPIALDRVRDFKPDLILLDLGVSSRQLDQNDRGFSFRPGISLDMRMSQAGLDAADFLNQADESELTKCFREYGDESRSRALAKAVLRRRIRQPFLVSDDFVNAIREVLGPRSGPGDFARLFQAVRIAVNQEIDGLAQSLPLLRAALAPGGLLAVISYHSGEDRIVKNAFRDWSRTCRCHPDQPVCTCSGKAWGRTQTRKAVTPGAAELRNNPRARSAKLRIFKVADEGQG